MPDTYSKRLSKAKNKTKELSNIMVEQDLDEITLGSMRIKIKEKKLTKSGNIEIHPEVYVSGKLIEFPKNALPLIYINPGFIVGTGTFRTETQGEEELQIEETEENPKKALEIYVLRTVANLIRKWQQ